MKIKVKDFVRQIVDGDFISSEIVIDVKNIDSAIKQAVSDFQTNIEAGQLSQQILIVTGFVEDFQIRLESGIINLPFSNIKKVDNFFDDQDEEVDVNLYLIVEANALNASKFRIDKVKSVDEVVQQPASSAKQLIEMIQLDQKKIQNNLEDQEQK